MKFNVTFTKSEMDAICNVTSRIGSMFGANMSTLRIRLDKFRDQFRDDAHYECIDYRASTRIIGSGENREYTGSLEVRPAAFLDSLETFASSCKALAPIIEGTKAIVSTVQMVSEGFNNASQRIRTLSDEYARKHPDRRYALATVVNHEEGLATLMVLEDNGWEITCCEHHNYGSAMVDPKEWLEQHDDEELRYDIDWVTKEEITRLTKATRELLSSSMPEVDTTSVPMSKLANNAAVVAYKAVDEVGEAGDVLYGIAAVTWDNAGDINIVAATDIRRSTDFEEHDISEVGAISGDQIENALCRKFDDAIQTGDNSPVLCIVPIDRVGEAFKVYSDIIIGETAPTAWLDII